MQVQSGYCYACQVAVVDNCQPGKKSFLLIAKYTCNHLPNLMEKKKI